MEHLLESLLRFPTVIWSVPMTVVVIYWGLALLGAVGVDTLDADTGADLDLDAGAEALGGDVDLDAGAEALGDVDADADVDLEAGSGGMLSHLADFLAVGTVPLTLVISMINTLGWALSFSTELVAGDFLREVLGGVGYGIIGFIAVFLAAVWLSSKLIRPLRPMFTVHTILGQHSLVGRTATISSSRVSDRFGTATVPAPDGSGPLHLNVVYEGAHTFVQGEEAAIVAYDDAERVYRIAPMNATAIGDLDASLRHSAAIDGRSASNGGDPTPTPRTPTT